MAQAVAGTLSTMVNGQLLQVDMSANIQSSNIERESKVGSNTGNGYYGYTEKNVAAFIEVDVVDSAAVDINVLANLTNATIQVDLINGKSCVLNNAVQVLAVQLNAITGVYKLKFEGSIGTWF